jgi:hypothetical protein
MSSKTTVSSPLSHSPKTIGECLDCRKTIERRVINCLTNANNDASLVFWKEGQCTLPTAESQIQSVLDRYQAVCELTEIINATSTLKMTDVTMPSFCEGMQPVQFTLGQLRDTKSWFLPMLITLVNHLTQQANTVKQECQTHDMQINQSLQAELEKNKRDHEERKKKARQYGEDEPTDDVLNVVQETAKNRAKSQMAIMVDPVGIRDLVSRLRTFVTMLETFADVKIDAANSTDITIETSAFKDLREQAFEQISTGKEAEQPKTKEGYQVVSLAELKIMMETLKENILSAIAKLRLVSYQKGQNKPIEHSDVEYAKTRLFDVLYNINVLVQSRQSFREGMSLHFPTMHPLSGVPLSVDGLVRLGYIKETKKVAPKRQAPSRQNKRMPYQQPVQTWEDGATIQDTVSDNFSLAECLNKLFSMMDSVDSKVTTAKREHDKSLQDSISAKQEARTKNSQSMKPGELDEIAKSIRASEAKTWTVADGLDKTLARISQMTQKITELQSSVRKSANSTIKVSVPIIKEMTWALSLDEMEGW